MWEGGFAGERAQQIDCNKISKKYTKKYEERYYYFKGGCTTNKIRQFDEWQAEDGQLMACENLAGTRGLVNQVNDVMMD